MNWVYIALLSPALWAMTNHIDKYLIERELQDQKVGSLLLFSSLIGLVPLVLILIARPQVLSIAPWHGALIVLNGGVYVLGLLPYYYALQRDEASIVVPLFQTATIFSYGLGLLILGEQLTSQQLLASLLIISGAVLLSIELNVKSFTFKFKVFALMMLASCLNALNWLLFKVVAIQEEFWLTSFWEYTGFVAIGGCLLIFVRSYRQEFIVTIRCNRFSVIGLVAINEVISLAAKTATNVASLVAPIALVSTLHGLQPLFVFVYGILLTICLPRYVQEQLQPHLLLQKTIAIALSIVGTALLTSQ